MRTLVTGGAGFIGSHVVDALVERGDAVLIADDFSTGKSENVAEALERGARLVELDVSDPEAMQAAGEEFEPDAVLHLAAQIDVRKSVADPAFDARVNVIGTINALELAASAGAERFVFASTGGAIYGEGEERPDEMPFAETARCEPFSAYGQSKLAAEGYIELYRRTQELAGVVLRLGNVYGPRQDPATEAGVVAIFCRVARDGGRPTVFGTGEQTRDYIHVDDVVAAFLAALERGGFGPYNIGTGVETNVLELAEAIGRLGGRDHFEPQPAPHREGEVERTAIDPRRAGEELGWRPRLELERGLELTLAAEA
jgi:UDP-glucose 4-epimerase